MRRVRDILAIVVLVTVTSGGPALAQTAPPTPTPLPGGAPGVTSVAAVLVNITDGDHILFTRSGTAQRAPASLTKVMTALVARDEYELDEVVTADPIVLNTHGSDLGLEPGMQITVRDLLGALLIKSANDAGMALAAHHTQGYEHFIQLMNEKARALGAYDTQFRNPHGLDQDGHFSSARDMAVFARELLADPALAQIVDAPEWNMTWKGRPRVFGTHHKLIRTHPEVIGVKTGFTDNAGHCLISAARTDVGVLVTVVMGSQNHYQDTLSLFDYGRSSERTEGGGGAEGFGRLPAPPAPPDIGLAAGGLRDGSDPRDDLRWALLMMTLALGTAALLLHTRRRQQPAAVDVWIAELARASAPERRRR
jgi:D-alanyl-D-alanine carboxypeptidase